MSSNSTSVPKSESVDNRTDDEDDDGSLVGQLPVQPNLSDLDSDADSSDDESISNSTTPSSRSWVGRSHPIFSESKYYTAAEALLGIKRPPPERRQVAAPVPVLIRSRSRPIALVPASHDLVVDGAETATASTIESDSGPDYMEEIIPGAVPYYSKEYISVVVQSPQPQKDWTTIHAMLYYCFDCLISKLNHLPMPRGVNLPKKQTALFVKWTKGPEGNLRGCLGSFHPFLLAEALQKYAISSATKDSRFPPILLKEVKDLKVTVSLVRTFDEATDYLDWELGKHGIYLRFKLEEIGQIVTASFLPEVAVMSGWTKSEAIDELIRKAGHEDEITPEFRRQVEVRKFETDEYTASYMEYKEARRVPSVKFLTKSNHS